MKIFNSGKTVYFVHIFPIKYNKIVVSAIDCYHVMPFWSADDPEVELDAGCKCSFNILGR